MSYDALISDAEDRYGIPAGLLSAVINKGERSGPQAVSPKGALGVAQLMPGTARDMGVQDPTDPAQGIEGGAKYLASMLKQFGDPKLAVAAYNAGPGNVRKYGGVPPFRETQNYVGRVTGSNMGASDWSDIFGGAPPTPAPAQQGGSGWSDIFQAPASQASAPAAAPSPVPAKPAIPMRQDQGLGFQAGLMKPLDNAAMALEYSLKRLGVPVDKIDSAFGGKSAAQAADDHAQAIAAAGAQGRAPGAAGQWTGNVLGTLPVALATKNPLMAGAMSGALLTDHRDLPGVAGDAGIGAATGAIAAPLLGAAGKALQGGSKQVQTLLKAGVKLSPGQVLGGAARRIEDRLTSIPFVGDAIAGVQAAATPSLNRAAANDVLSSVGQKLPSTVAEGHDAVQYAAKTLSDGYNKLLAPLTVKLDPQFAAGMNKLAPDIASLAPADQAQMQDILRHQVARRLGTGPITGEALKDVESYLTSTIRSFYKNPNKGEMADVLASVQGEFRDMLARQNPQAAEALKAANLGWAKLYRLEGAAANATDGIASPAQLKASVVRMAGRRSAAQGQGLMQDLSNAGAAVIPRVIGNSGSADRLLQNSLTGLVAAAGASPLLPLYTGAGQKIVSGLFGGSRPVAAKAAGQLLSSLKTPAVIGGAALTVGAKKK